MDEREDTCWESERVLFDVRVRVKQLTGIHRLSFALVFLREE